MSSDRWRRLEELCHVALACAPAERTAFLENACRGDEALRLEVESLLAQESSAETFMSVPAAMLAGSAGLDPPARTLIGARFGSYTIRSLLGIGGMGEVYRAHDQTLGREVAIKVLSPGFTADPDRRARFEREARMLATLNHPHIGAIYGVEEADGVRALALELVEGETLGEYITRPRRNAGAGLPVTEALTIARQIADALEAAHEKGIVHRDLKPANIKIRPDGVVKVLDFGLAKAATPDTVGSDPTHSRAGAVFGTAAYMSPEQARGHQVDKRADIWAFGCVLFEMLTGQVAFAGDTASDTIARILEREPDWRALPSATPVPIRRLLFRCLAKDSKHRLRDVGDVRLEIDAINEVVPGIADVPVAAVPPAWRRWLPWALVAALAAVVAGVGVWEARRQPIVIVQEPPLANARFSYFTNWDGIEAGAEISPDGKFVAFKANADGQIDLWVSQVGTGRFLNLTPDIATLSLPGVVRTFGFSGDGAEIWFAEGGDSSAPKWLIPLTGGTRRAFLGQGTAAASWSPDDTRLVYFTNVDGDPISVADRSTADARALVVDTPGFFGRAVHNHNPAWSPDGQWLYFAHGLKPTEEMNVWRVRPSGGTPEQLTALRAAANHLAPLDQRTLLYVAIADDGSGPWLWSLDVETKVSRRVTPGPEHYSSVSASRDGRRVVTTVSSSTASLWRVPLIDREAEDRDVQPYAVPSSRALSPRFGGTSLFYVSGQGAYDDSLWRIQDGNTSVVWKVTNESLSEPPAVSPDGTRVAIVVKQQAKLRLLMMSADGTNARTLAPTIAIESSGGYGPADWSPDGTWIVATGTDAQGAGLFKIPVDGGEAVRLVSGHVVNPVWSPDGKLIVYGGPVVGGRVPLLGVKPDGTRVALPGIWTGMGGGHRFLPNGKGLVYMPRSESRNFWLFDLVTNKTHALTRLNDRGRMKTFDITPDGKAIVFDRIRDSSDIVLIDLPR